MKGVQCYELFGGIALKNHAFSFFSFIYIFRLVSIMFLHILDEDELSDNKQLSS